MYKSDLIMNAENLIKSLLDSKLIQSDKEISDFLIENQNKRDFSTYLKILGGIGAYISAICFIGFFVSFGFFDDKFTRIFLGILFVSLAIFENSLIKKNYSIKSSFLVQLSFAFMILGKIMFVTGFGEFLSDFTMSPDNGWNYSLSLFLVTLGSYFFYDRDRFLSLFVFLISILINIDSAISDNYNEIFINGYFLFQFICICILFMIIRDSRKYFSIAYSFVFSLSVTVLFITIKTVFINDGDFGWITWSFTNLILSLGMILLIYRILGNQNVINNKAFLGALSGVFLLGVISSSGIIFVIFLMILGYWRHEKILLVLSVLLMPVFLISYFYSLDLLLIQKSIVLVMSGILLLGIRFFLNKISLDA